MTEPSSRRALGAEIRRQRKLRKMTQGELAASTGVSIRTIVSIEKGEHATQPGNVEAVMRVLGMELEPAVDRDAWPADVQVFLDMMGAFLAAQPEDRRVRLIGDITRGLFAQ